MTEPLADLRRSFGEEIRLTISTTTNIKCSFLWKRIGQELKPNDPLCSGSNTETLHFKRFCKVYEGTYTCTVIDQDDMEHSESLSATLTFDGLYIVWMPTISYAYYNNHVVSAQLQKNSLYQ